MRKIILYSACSIDGFIAKTNGDINWIDTEVDLGEFSFESFLNSVDAILMGGKSYRQVLSFDNWAFGNHKTYVFSKSQEKSISANTCIISNLDVDYIHSLKKDKGKDIWLFGGGQLNHFFLINDLIDELMLFVQPVVLGSGISIFGNQTSQLKQFNRKKAVELANDFTLLWYKK